MCTTYYVHTQCTCHIYVMYQTYMYDCMLACCLLHVACWELQLAHEPWRSHGRSALERPSCLRPGKPGCTEVDRLPQTSFFRFRRNRRRGNRLHAQPCAQPPGQARNPLLTRSFRDRFVRRVRVACNPDRQGDSRVRRGTGRGSCSLTHSFRLASTDGQTAGSVPAGRNPGYTGYRGLQRCPATRLLSGYTRYRLRRQLSEMPCTYHGFLPFEPDVIHELVANPEIAEIEVYELTHMQCDITVTTELLRTLNFILLLKFGCLE